MERKESKGHNRPEVSPRVHTSQIKVSCGLWNVFDICCPWSKNIQFHHSCKKWLLHDMTCKWSKNISYHPYCALFSPMKRFQPKWILYQSWTCSDCTAQAKNLEMILILIPDALAGPKTVHDHAEYQQSTVQHFNAFVRNTLFITTTEAL